MFRRDMWPFTPEKLSDVIDKETLSVLQAGCCERLGRSLIIYDYVPVTGDFSERIEPIELRQHFEKFCDFLRNDEYVQGGDSLCKQCNLTETQKSLVEFRQKGKLFRSFVCCMGLMEVSHVIQVGNKPLALLYSGQYRPDHGVGEILENVANLGRQSDCPVQLDDASRNELLHLTNELKVPPADLPERLYKEAAFIQNIAENEYQQQKYKWEQGFLDELRLSINHNGVPNLKSIRRNVTRLLGRVRAFCRCEYAVFFGSEREHDTVLAVIAADGVPAEINQNLPHFNWKKAGLSLEHFNAQNFDIIGQHSDMRKRGIRGDNSQFFADRSYVLPVSLDRRYRGVLVLGNFAEEINFQAEKRFLLEIAGVIGSFALTELEIRSLERKHKQSQSTADLLAHQIGTALTPITTQIGRALHLTRKPDPALVMPRVKRLLERMEKLNLHLADGARQTLKGQSLQIEPDDMEFEAFPLSVLVTNCAQYFIPKAQKENKYLIIDKSIELLPEAEVDIARLIIALSNLLDNAVKYSFLKTTIYVRSSLHNVADPEHTSAIIEVDNIGYQIPSQIEDEIFKQGVRGLTKAKLGIIPGSGLGLWEAKAVLVAHRGDIKVRCIKTSIRRAEGVAYRVIFLATVPLKQQK